jgi:predicted nucleic acid-binding protein
MYLVDTNVLLALFIRQTRWWLTARELYVRDPDWCTEMHALVELTNVLTRYVRIGELTFEEGRSVLQEAVARLEPRLLSVEHADALRVAVERGVSAYDARFLVAARQLGKRLVTEDGKLRAAAPELTQSLDEALAISQPAQPSEQL